MARTAFPAAIAVIIVVCTACLGDEPTVVDAPTRGDDGELDRPLHVPILGVSQVCPRTPGARPNPDVAITLGAGPAYPVLGFEKAPPSPKGVVLLADEERKAGWYWQKTLWAVDPSYDGPVLIRGRGIRPPRDDLRFGYDDRQLDRLEMIAEETDSWRYAPSSTLIPGPGCYALQIDGIGFSRVVVFEARR